MQLLTLTVLTASGYKDILSAPPASGRRASLPPDKIQ